MFMKNRDKNIERKRYELRAKSIKSIDKPELGSAVMPKYLSECYKKYESIILKEVIVGSRVLELAAGTGENTKILLDTKAYVVATDLSVESLKVLKKKFGNNSYLLTFEADIELLPFEDSSFDFVCCAGGLSYGEKNKTVREIIRVLRPGGNLICVDSLDNNPIYKLNRLVHYLFGRRTFSTLQNMPTVESLICLTKQFKNTKIYYFGALTFLLPFLIKIAGENLSAKILRKFDKKFKTKKSAFKFVLFASDLKK